MRRIFVYFVLHYCARRYDRVILESQKVLQAHPDFHVAHRNLGLAFEQEHLYAQAIAELDAARRLDPESPFPVGCLGHAYAASGDPDKARGMHGRKIAMEKRAPGSPTPPRPT